MPEQFIDRRISGRGKNWGKFTTPDTLNGLYLVPY